MPAQQYGLKLVGKVDLGGKLAGAGRVADVSAKGNYAYLTMFYEPTCGRGGVQIVDIANPAKPVMKGYIPSHTDTFSGEGSQVITMNTPSFKGDLLVYQNEWCPGTTNGVGGITLVDVRNPSSPKKLVEGAGDFTKKDGTQSKGVPQTRANQTHSAFAWTNKETGKVYVVLVDDMEEPDVDILDITNPSKPKLVSETNLDQFAQTGADPAARRLGVQPRHDRQAHRQPRHHADELLGRRLRHARRDRPGEPEGAVGHRLRRRRPGARGARPDDHARGQRPPGGVHP